MKKKMALFMALVMLAILPFDAVSAAGNGSGEAVIISEDVDGAAETTASEDTESGEIVVESAEKIQGETDAQQETAAESETQALDTTETESAAETEAEATTEAVTEAAAESEASQTEAVEAETSEGMTSQTELVEAETSEDMASVEAEEEIETSDAAASQAESSEDDAQAAETEADDGILVASVEEVESTEEEAGIQTASTSTELSVNKTYSLADIIGSTQYFSVSAAGRVQFIVQNSVNTSFGLYVYDTGLLSSYCKVSMTAGLESATSNYVTLPEAKQYSFKISGSTPNSEATLYIKYEAAGTYYGETESNDSFDTANGIQFNVEYEGMLGGSEDEIDYYKFTLSSSSKVGMSFDFLDTEMTEYNDVYVYLYSEDSNGNTTRLVNRRTDDGYRGYGTDFYDLRLPAGNYYVVIEGGWNKNIPYSFKVTSSAESEASYEIEKNDLTSQANNKQTNNWYTGNINIFENTNGADDSSDIDWFSYSVSEKCYLTVELKTPRQSSGTVTATLYQLSGQELVEVTTITSGSNPYISSEKIFSQAGTYYLKMTGSSADWDYSVCLTQDEYVALTGISLPSTASVVNGSTLSLSPTFKPSNASEQGLTWTSSNTDVATVDENGKITALSVGKTTITATSSFSDSSSVKAKCTVYVTRKVTLKLTSVENKATGIKLTWNKVSGASGYYVYRRTASGKFSKIKTITSGSTVTYTDKSIKSKNGKTYVYKVVPYSNYITGSGTGKKITRLTGTKLSSLSSSSIGKMTVKWKKASNVSGYQIQYSTSKKFASGNKTKLVSGKSKTSYTLSGLTAGKTYYVRVRTYKTVSGKKYYSAWSSTSSKTIENLIASYSYSKTDQSKTYGNVKANVYYQKVVLKGSSSAIAKINSSINSDMNSFLNSSNKSSLYEYAESGNEAGCRDNYYYTATSTVTYNNSGIISIQVKTYWYAGGVSNTDVYGLTYDLSTGEKLTLVDVCEGSASTIKSRVVTKVTNSDDSSSIEWKTLNGYTTKKMDFYLKPNYKAVVCFGPYEINYGGWYRTYTIRSKYK